jgi:hypothetical protein
MGRCSNRGWHKFKHWYPPFHILLFLIWQCFFFRCFFVCIWYKLTLFFLCFNNSLSFRNTILLWTIHSRFGTPHWNEQFSLISEDHTVNKHFLLVPEKTHCYEQFPLVFYAPHCNEECFLVSVHHSVIKNSLSFFEHHAVSYNSFSFRHTTLL